MKMLLIGLASLALGACATVPADGPPPPPTAGSVQTIRYETGPCFGVCPVYAVTVGSDGSGTFEGRQHTAAIGERRFSVTPAQFAAFRDRLAPYRPSGERRIAPPDCNGREATDLPSVDVTWSGKGPQSHLYAYFGCDMEGNAATFAALRSAPEALPIYAFVGRR